MSNKTELQANNVELQEILDSVNALPDAGSGGRKHIVTIEMTRNFTSGLTLELNIYDGSSFIQKCRVLSETTTCSITVEVGTGILVLEDATFSGIISSSAGVPIIRGYVWIFNIQSDTIISVVLV